jgi:hypothetical protein
MGSEYVTGVDVTATPLAGQYPILLDALVNDRLYQALCEQRAEIDAHTCGQVRHIERHCARRVMATRM